MLVFSVSVGGPKNRPHKDADLASIGQDLGHFRCHFRTLCGWRLSISAIAAQRALSLLEGRHAFADGELREAGQAVCAELVHEGAVRIYEIRQGALRVKDGIGGLWTRVLPGGPVRQVQLKGDYVGLLLDDGLFRVKSPPAE
jgi:hypothetical protein